MDRRTLGEHTQELSLNILHQGSLISELYVLKASYMISLEECRMSDDTLFYTAITPGAELLEERWHITEGMKRKRPLHQHNFLEIMYVLEGRLIQHIEEHTYEYDAGECCILNNHMKHCEEFSTDFKAVFLMLSDDFLRFLMRMDLVPEQTGGLRRRKSPILSFASEMLEKNAQLNKTYLDFIPNKSMQTQCQAAEELFCHLLQETKEAKPGAYLMAAGLVNRFFAVLEDRESYEMRQAILKDSRDKILFAEVTRIMESCGGHITRSELEKMTNYSGDYLNWIIKKHTGKTLTEYGQTFCMGRAVKLLMETNLTVSAIIRELGFTNRSYFYQLFEQQFGMTPKMYRVSGKRDGQNV